MHTPHDPALIPASAAGGIPAGACDCHVHIFGDPAQFPMSPARVYTPPPALPEELAALHRSLGIQRVVIVTPSIYGTDNSATLHGIQARGREARGIALIDEHTTEAELDALGRGGICGIRLNFSSGGAVPDVNRQRLSWAISRIKQRGWHVQLLTTLMQLAAVKEVILDSPVPIVVDHFGGADAVAGVEQPGFADLLEMVQSGRAYVKISAAYRVSNQPPEYADAAPLAKALIAANPERVVWGTDWPHPDSAAHPGKQPRDVLPRLPVDDAKLLGQLSVLEPNAEIRRKILVDNPVCLYGF